MESSILNMGIIIREMRKAKSFTQDALAQAAGVSIQAVSKWETGQSLPDVALLPAIADFLETNIDVLFGRAAASCRIERMDETDEKERPFPDDGKLRVVQYLGARMLSADECANEKSIPLSLDHSNGPLAVEIHGSARINGTVNGSVSASQNVFVAACVNGNVNAGGNVTYHGHIDGKDVNLKSISSDLGSLFSSLFGKQREAASTSANMNAFFSGELPDDDVLRVIQLKGRRVISAEESAENQIIHLSIDPSSAPLNVHIYGCAEIRGDVHGNASVGGSLTCSAVGGNASVGDSAEIHGDVHGNVIAGDQVFCCNAGGNVKTAKEGRKHTSNDVQGHGETPDLSVFPADSDVLTVVQVLNGKVLSAEESQNNRPIHLALDNADGLNICVQGNLHCEGSIEGDVCASGSVSCGDIEGAVTIESTLKCGDIDGCLTAVNAVVCCGDIEGDVTIHGPNNESTLKCGDIDGCLTAINSVVSCGDIEGDVSASSDAGDCRVQCVNVAGDVTVTGEFSCEGNIEGGVYRH